MRQSTRTIAQDRRTHPIAETILLATESFAVILCDLRMPLMNGERFVASLPPSVAALVVFMSGAEEREVAVSLHPRLLKPFTLAELKHAIACRCPAAALTG